MFLLISNLGKSDVKLVIIQIFFWYYLWSAGAQRSILLSAKLETSNTVVRLSRPDELSESDQDLVSSHDQIYLTTWILDGFIYLFILDEKKNIYIYIYIIVLCNLTFADVFQIYIIIMLLLLSI